MAYTMARGRVNQDSSRNFDQPGVVGRWSKCLGQILKLNAS